MSLQFVLAFTDLISKNVMKNLSLILSTIILSFLQVQPMNIFLKRPSRLVQVLSVTIIMVPFTEVVPEVAMIFLISVMFGKHLN